MGKILTPQSNLYQLIMPIVENLGYECWGIEFLSNRGSKMLRIYIDQEAGITLDDCEKVSRQVSATMDVENPISDKYILEVSSPGLDRTFFNVEQMTHYVGEMIKVKLLKPLENKRKLIGELTDVDLQKKQFSLRTENEILNFGFNTVDKVSLVPHY